MSDAWTCPADRFPIGPSTAYGKPKLTVPLALVLECERQAQINHGQSVARLKERGGLSWCELAAVLDGRRWEAMKLDAAHESAMRRVLSWQAMRQAQADLDRMSELSRHSPDTAPGEPA